MADPIRELILQDIKTALEAVLTANGFEQDIQIVRRPAQNPVVIDARPGFNLIDLGDSDQVPGSRLESQNRLKFAVGVVAEEADEEKISAKVERLRADATKKLYEDRTRGGDAISTQVESGTTGLHQDEIPLGTALVNGEVVYRVEIMDPFTKKDI